MASPSRVGIAVTPVLCEFESCAAANELVVAKVSSRNATLVEEKSDTNQPLNWGQSIRSIPVAVLTVVAVCTATVLQVPGFPGTRAIS